MSEANSIAVQLIYNDFATTNASSASYTQLVASLNLNSGFAQISNSSTSTIKLAVGPTGSEGDVIYIPPSSVCPVVGLLLPKGGKLSMRAVDATASSGKLIINLFR